MTDIYPLAILLCTFLLGLIFGSFYNVCIHRFITGESIVMPPSHCPHCKGRLHARDLVPVFSYLALGGRCRMCKKPITMRYPLVELLTGALALLIVQQFGFTWAALVYFIFCSALLIASFIDIQIYILPDIITITGAILAPFAAIFILAMPWQESIYGALAGGLCFLLIRVIFYKLRGIEGLGLGDVKLMFLIGGICGIMALPLQLLLSGVLALAGALIMYMWSGKKRSASSMHIPFGPFLSLSAIIMMLYGSTINAWWFALAGGY